MERKKMFYILSIGLMIGFALPNQSNAFKSDEMQFEPTALCWDQPAEGGVSGDGFYQCNEGNTSCSWLAHKKKSGSSRVCGAGTVE